MHYRLREIELYVSDISIKLGGKISQFDNSGRKKKIESKRLKELEIYTQSCQNIVTTH